MIEERRLQTRQHLAQELEAAVAVFRLVHKGAMEDGVTLTKEQCSAIAYPLHDYLDMSGAWVD